MTRKLFGTDGVRGKANQYPMTAEMARSKYLEVTILWTTSLA